MADEAEVVVADPRAEVTVRGGDGLPVLGVATSERELAARDRDAVMEFLENKA